MIAESQQLLEIGRRLVDYQSATENCVGIVCNHCNWSAISRRPPKTFLRWIWSQGGFTCSNQNLLATKSSLQPSATSRRPPCNGPATSLWPPEILVTWRSPTGCKLCVTGALGKCHFRIDSHVWLVRVSQGWIPSANHLIQAMMLNPWNVSCLLVSSCPLTQGLSSWLLPCC